VPSRSSARSAASSVQDNTAFRVAARCGYVVNGLLHILIGAIALTVAFGGGGSADTGGALEQVASAPAGEAILWFIAAGLWALALFQLLEAAIVRGTDRDAWMDRLKQLGKAVAYAAVGFSAFGAASGSSSGSGDSDVRQVSSTLLASPFGVALLFVVALGILAIGVYFIAKGARQKFVEDLRVPTGELGRATIASGTVGYIAKGVAISVVGVLFAIAAFTTDADAAAGLDGALKALVEVPFGPIVLGAVALGLILYGIYCFVRARYARL
jgi:hypothetical protein